VRLSRLPLLPSSFVARCGRPSLLVALLAVVACLLVVIRVTRQTRDSKRQLEPGDPNKRKATKSPNRQRRTTHARTKKANAATHASLKVTSASWQKEGRAILRTQPSPQSTKGDNTRPISQSLIFIMSLFLVVVITVAVVAAVHVAALGSSDTQHGDSYSDDGDGGHTPPGPLRRKRQRRRRRLVIPTTNVNDQNHHRQHTGGEIEWGRKDLVDREFWTRTLRKGGSSKGGGGMTESYNSMSMPALNKPSKPTEPSGNEEVEGDGPGADETNDECVVPEQFAPSEDQTLAVQVVTALIRGDFFSSVLQGMRAQLENGVQTGRINMLIADATDGDALTSQDDIESLQAQMISDGINGEGNPTVAAIITISGRTTVEFCSAVGEATRRGIPVVSFDLNGEACGPQHLLTSQSDEDMASFVLEQARQRYTGQQNINVGYITDLQFRPLINRGRIWEQYKEANGWNQLFEISNASLYATGEDLQDAVADELAKLYQPLDFIYAPWDYLAQNTLNALVQTESSNRTKLYGADINDADIAAMTAPQSPWFATAGDDPASIGAAVARMALLRIGDVPISEIVVYKNDQSNHVTIPTTLVTQPFLLGNTIANMQDLCEALPQLKLDNIAQACWIEPTATCE